ncbi:MAG: hypothetical protein NT067_07540 [Candidatus Diapherotrites archaeon]|nr:hypothetical protein [Candidatus Diapherotrites archaeon]
MKRFYLAVAFATLLLCSGASVAGFTPVITWLKVGDVSMAAGPTTLLVSAQCYDTDLGKEIPSGSTTIDLKFFQSSGMQITTPPPTPSNIACSSGPTPVPVSITFPNPGVYYAEATFSGSSPGIPEKAWFAVSRPFPIINVPDANPLAALAACVSVLLISGRKAKKK